MNKILLNKKEYKFSINDLPCLIHGKEGSGASFFSVFLISKLFQAGNKILFFTAYPMAKEELQNQIGNQGGVDFIEKGFQIKNANSKAIIMKSGDEKLFLKAIEELCDINERIIFIKNVENYKKELFKKLINYNRIIISGDLDQCNNFDLIDSIKYKIKILFSDSKNDLQISLPQLKKYEGYFFSKNKEGILNIK